MPNPPNTRTKTAPTETSIHVSTGDKLRLRAAANASHALPTIHQNAVPATGHVSARQNSGSMPRGTNSRRAKPSRVAGEFSSAGAISRTSEAGRRSKKYATAQPYTRRTIARVPLPAKTNGKQTAACAVSSRDSLITSHPAAQSPNDAHTDPPAAPASTRNRSSSAPPLSLPPSPPGQTPHPDRSPPSPSAPSRPPASPD
jgi:hypothetical protein